MSFYSFKWFRSVVCRCSQLAFIALAQCFYRSFLTIEWFRQSFCLYVVYFVCIDLCLRFYNDAFLHRILRLLSIFLHGILCSFTRDPISEVRIFARDPMPFGCIFMWDPTPFERIFTRDRIPFACICIWDPMAFATTLEHGSGSGRIQRIRCQEPRLGTTLPRAPGARMT